MSRIHMAICSIAGVGIAAKVAGALEAVCCIKLFEVRPCAPNEILQFLQGIEKSPSRVDLQRTCCMLYPLSSSLLPDPFLPVHAPFHRGLLPPSLIPPPRLPSSTFPTSVAQLPSLALGLSPSTRLTIDQPAAPSPQPNEQPVAAIHCRPFYCKPLPLQLMDAQHLKAIKELLGTTSLVQLLLDKAAQAKKPGGEGVHLSQSHRTTEAESKARDWG